MDGLGIIGAAGACEKLPHCEVPDSEGEGVIPIPMVDDDDCGG